ncbi:lysophospholipid acyltransferase family protein [Mesorhizobium sp. A623]
MSADEQEKEAPVRKRRAWVYKRELAPKLTGTGEHRLDKLFRYWVTDNFWNVANLAGHYVLKLLPMDACSKLGAALGEFAMPRFHKMASQRARNTIRQLCPDMNEDERYALFRENCRAQGQLMAEFLIVARLRKYPERLEAHGLDSIIKAAGNGPVILVGMHLGNWEVGSIALGRANLALQTFHVPPRGRAKAWIAERVRRGSGIHFLPPGVQGVRPAIRILKAGGIVSAFCDEGYEGKIRGPFFGSKPHLEGNIATVVRMARLTEATICPWYCIRGEGFRFACHALEPIRLPAESNPGGRLQNDLLLLNDAIEKVVRAHLGQWYFLDNDLEGTKP